MRFLHAAVTTLALTLGAAPAQADCFRNCFTYAEHKPSSVIPDPDSFQRFGDLFTSQYRSYDLRNDAQVAVNLGFDLRIGGALFNSVLLHENGFISFAPSVASSPDEAAESAFVPLRSLGDYGGPIIAPFYADLIGTTAGDAPRIGQVIVQYGFADPTADANGGYDRADLLQAVRISWYGLVVQDAATVVHRAFAQVLLTNEGGGDFDFEFRSGDPNTNNGAGPFTQPGYGSIAGFSLGGTTVDFTGPYDGFGEPSYFVFRDGAFQSPVPEPATWGLMIAGLALVGGALRGRRQPALA